MIFFVQARMNFSHHTTCPLGIRTGLSIPLQTTFFHHNLTASPHRSLNSLFFFYNLSILFIHFEYFFLALKSTLPFNTLAAYLPTYTLGTQVVTLLLASYSIAKQDSNATHCHCHSHCHCPLSRHPHSALSPFSAIIRFASRFQSIFRAHFITDVPRCLLFFFSPLNIINVRYDPLLTTF